jgi:hypothetical protein
MNVKVVTYACRDGPFAELKIAIGGYALQSRADAVRKSGWLVIICANVE